MIVAAALCPSPPLLDRELTGQDLVLPGLRDACATAVRRLLASAPDLVAVVGPARATQALSGVRRFDATAYAPALAPARSVPSAGRLPLSLGIGSLLLDEACYPGERLFQAVASAAPPRECLRLGRELAGVAPRVALLAMGDGTARRSTAAPGYLDERAAPFDAAVERAVRHGDLAALASLDPALAADLMATGRPAWQALAGALAPPAAGRPPVSGSLRAEILYCDAPLGVGYLAAVLTVAPAP